MTETSPSGDPRILGEGLLKHGHALIARFDSLVSEAIPKRLNPLVQAGAVVNTCFFIAAITGVLLLFWYVPSVHKAYDSVRAMDAASWTSGLVRSLHRYSSDACILMVLIHTIRILCARRFVGPRWFAWVTGFLSLLLLWFVGWLGYWLVWDERAQQVAVGTARMFDMLPVFADPLSRSFVADEAINSLLFFVVFFGHMLISIVMVIGLWLHIARLARARFLASRELSIWITLTLVVVSLVYPAQASEPAAMAVAPQSFAMDWWYLAPLALTDRLSGGVLWLIVLGIVVTVTSLPWTLRRGKTRVASVHTMRCNACKKCTQNCPYNAIEMVPRTDGMKFDVQAEVYPNLCVGCGICSGSCDSAGIGLTWFSVLDKRSMVDIWLAYEFEHGKEDIGIAFACSDSAATRLDIDPSTGRCPQLPGYRVMEIPCVGWIHAKTIERALRRGAREVLVVACGEGICRYREGQTWFRERMFGDRQPTLRRDRIDVNRVRFVNLVPGQESRLLQNARSYVSPLRAQLRRVAGVVVLLALFATMILVSDFPYRSPGIDAAELVVSFKHPGRTSEIIRVLTDAELAHTPVHMRRKMQIGRTRSAVRLRVYIDSTLVFARTYIPRGLWRDGNSIAIERLPVGVGTHVIKVEVGESPDQNEWSFVEKATVIFKAGRRETVVFNRHDGFQWY